MKKSKPGELKTKLARFLLHYRTTPHATTGMTPAELLMRRPLRTHLDLMRPNISARVESKQLSQSVHHDSKSRERSFLPQDKVYVRTAGSSSPWIPGTTTVKNGSVHYEVRLEDERLVRRHIDHIQPRASMPTESPVSKQVEDGILEPLDIPFPSTSTSVTSPPEEPITPEDAIDQRQPRRSTRVSRPPARYGNPLTI